MRKSCPLGDAHGDVEPPRLAAHGKVLVVGGARARAQRSRRSGSPESTDGKVTWGATVHERAASRRRSTSPSAKRRASWCGTRTARPRGSSRCRRSTAADSGNATPAAGHLAATADAESPRLVARARGLLAGVHRAQRGADVDTDARYVAEEIGFRWIEIVALDGNGSPSRLHRAP